MKQGPGGRETIDRALLDALASIASSAAAAILGVGSAGVSRREKPDGSPVTAADEASESVILRGLRQLLPGIPAISEEASERVLAAATASRFLLVDPLDGTREFLAGLDEYTVNIALIDDGRPAAGVIAAPASGTVWAGLVGHGAERLTLAPGAAADAARERIAIRTRPRPQRGALALVSRFHPEPETEAYLDRMAMTERAVCGSALKFCRIADGAADLYVRMASLQEWDVAAGHALVAAAGGTVRGLDGQPLVYCGDGRRLPAFIATGDGAAI